MSKRFAEVRVLADAAALASVHPTHCRVVRRAFLSTAEHLPRDYCKAHDAEILASESVHVDAEGRPLGPAEYALRVRRKDRALISSSVVVSSDLRHVVLEAIELKRWTHSAKISYGGDLGFFRVIEYVGGLLDGVAVAEARIPEGEPADLVDFAVRQATVPWCRSADRVLPPWLLRDGSRGRDEGVVDVSGDQLDFVAAGILSNDGGPRGRFYKLAAKLPTPRLDPAEVDRAAAALVEAEGSGLRPLVEDLDRFRDQALRRIELLATTEIRASLDSDDDPRSLPFGPRLRPRIGYRDAFDRAVADRCAAILSKVAS